MPNNEDLVTGTPVTQKSVQDVIIYYNKNIELFKIIQRVIMTILTVAVLVSVCYVGKQMGELKSEIRTVVETVESTRLDINTQIEEIQKDGIKFHIRLW